MKDILTLWDIDGNLVNVYKYQTLAYQKAIQIVYGVRLPFQVIEENYGLPSREVVAIAVRRKGIDEEIIQERIEKTGRRY
jgi:beta-phosphoglucomutase-like phosphatase (HAD superfamily)